MAPSRAIAFDDPVLRTPIAAAANGSRRDQPTRSGAYRLGWAVGRASVAVRPVLGWTLALACWPVTLYLLPALWAYRRGHPDRHGILLWTLLLAWTGYGWLAAWLYTAWTWKETP